MPLVALAEMWDVINERTQGNFQQENETIAKAPWTHKLEDSAARSVPIGELRSRLYRAVQKLYNLVAWPHARKLDSFHALGLR